MRIKKQVLKKPARFSLSESQEKKLYDYRVVFEKIFDEKIAVSDELIIKTREKLEDFDLLKSFESRYKQCRNYLSNLFDGYKDRIEKSTDSLKNVIGDEKNKVLTSFQNEFERLKPQSIKKEIISNSLIQLDAFFEDIKEKKEEQIGSFLKHIESLNLDIDEDVLTGYYKLQYEEIVKKWNQTKELAQLGITVEIIDHQFNALYSQVALSIKELKQYMDKDKGMQEYQSLKTSFEHLENKYRLMSPLYRTTGKVRKDITGEYIYNYLQFFFRDIFKEREIFFSISSNFASATFFTYESILLPAFINVINNAVYWLIPVEQRRIYIDIISDGKILIQNSGVPIEDFYLKDIFKLFYTRKPTGRGIGLYLAQETLSSIGYNIFASNLPEYNKLNGACFIIDTKPSKEQNENEYI